MTTPALAKAFQGPEAVPALRDPVRHRNLSLLTGDADGPVWSSDSRRIFYRSFREEPFGV